MTFSTDWFTKQQPDFEQQLKRFKDKDVQFLEIGSFEGRSALWMLQNILTHPSSRLICMDTWEGSEEYQKMDIRMADKLEVFKDNIKDYEDRVIVRQGKSQILLRDMDVNNKLDFIYIDGSHVACDVMEDIVLSWRILKSGGLLALDDYEWTYMDNPKREPKMAIDAFLSIWDGQYELLVKNWMVWVRKL